jgi:hypothetical protein
MKMKTTKQNIKRLAMLLVAYTHQDTTPADRIACEIEMANIVEVLKNEGVITLADADNGSRMTFVGPDAVENDKLYLKHYYANTK